MKLQFAFGNPRKRRSKKHVAKHKKSRKNRGMVKRKVSRKVKRKKNPKYYTVTSKSTKKRKYTSPKYKTASELRSFIKKEKASMRLGKGVRKLEEAYKRAPEASAEKQKLRKALASAKSKRAAVVGKLKSEKESMEIERRTMRRYQEDPDNEIKVYSTEGKPVAKKRRKKRKSKKVRKAKKHSASPKRKKRRSKKRRVKHASKKHSGKKSKRSKRRKSGKRRRRSRMLTHRHKASTRHIAKGATAKISGRKRKGAYKVKAYFGKGKKKVRISGSVRVRGSSLRGKIKANPHRRNPMAANVEKYLGHKVAELSALAAGGALVPLINKAVGKYVPSVANMINQYAGPQATGSIIPILFGVIANIAAEHVPGKTREYVEAAGEGLVAAGVIGLAMSVSQNYVAPMLGLSGINFTPMRGINYTPMKGINYTPSMRGADYGGSGGYTQDHKHSRADFGIMPQLNGADFGQAQDEDYDIADDDMLSDNMGGMN